MDAEHYSRTFSETTPGAPSTRYNPSRQVSAALSASQPHIAALSLSHNCSLRTLLETSCFRGFYKGEVYLDWSYTFQTRYYFTVSILLQILLYQAISGCVPEQQPAYNSATCKAYLALSVSALHMSDSVCFKTLHSTPVAVIICAVTLSQSSTDTHFLFYSA